MNWGVGTQAIYSSKYAPSRALTVRLYHACMSVEQHLRRRERNPYRNTRDISKRKGTVPLCRDNPTVFCARYPQPKHGFIQACGTFHVRPISLLPRLIDWCPTLGTTQTHSRLKNREPFVLIAFIEPDAGHVPNTPVDTTCRRTKSNAAHACLGHSLSRG